MELKFPNILRILLLNLPIIFCFIIFGCKPASKDKTESVNFPAPTEFVKEIINGNSFPWDSIKTEHFVIYYLPGSYAENHLEFLKDKSEEAISRAIEVLRVDSYPFGMRLFMLESRDQMLKFIEISPKGIALYEHDAVLMVQNKGIRPYLRHEIFHIVSIKLWGLPETWLREGSAVFADGFCLKYELEELASYLVKTDKAVELKDLIENFGKTEDIITYLQSASLFKYIYENYPIEKLKLFWQKGSPDIQKTLGTDLKKLEADWKSNLLELEFDTSKINWDEITERGCG